MSKDLDIAVGEVLQVDSVSQAQRIMSSRSGVFLLATISFLEAALPLPILTDPFLVAAVLLDRTRFKILILVATVASVLGGLVAYVSAFLFLDTLLTWLSSGMVQEFQSMVAANGSSTLVLTLLGAVTPIPYTLVAWAVAVLQGNILVFAVASFLGRGGRYTIVGYLVYRFGARAAKYSKVSLGVISVVLFLVAAVYFLLHM